MFRRLDQDMNWDEICEHYGEQLKNKFPANDINKFVEWMKTRNVANGKVLFGSMTYLYCYIVSKAITTGKKDYFTVICGKEGSGKSWLGMMIAAVVSPTFSIKYIVYQPEKVFNTYKICSQGDTLLIDEGSRLLYSRRAMNDLNKDVTEVFMNIRKKYIHTIICIPHFRNLDTQLREKRADALFQVKPEENYQRKGYFRGMWSEAIEFVNNQIDKKREVLRCKMRNGDFWDDYARKLLPTINDLSEASYEAEKGKKLDDYLDNMANKWKSRAKNINNMHEEIENVDIEESN